MMHVFLSNNFFQVSMVLDGSNFVFSAYPTNRAHWRHRELLRRLRISLVVSGTKQSNENIVVLKMLDPFCKSGGRSSDVR